LELGKRRRLVGLKMKIEISFPHLPDSLSSTLTRMAITKSYAIRIGLIRRDDTRVWL
jgi:hypothetical protein